MKLGVLTVPLQGIAAEQAFEYLHGLGVQCVELGTGAYTNHNHCNPDVLLGDDAAIDALKASLAKNELTVAALSCHGNPVHPNKERAAADHAVFVQTCQLAQKLGVDTIVTFSGCPGDSEGSKYPNWVTCSWPDDYGKILEWQWNEVLIPYWKEAVKIAASYGVKKIALELHPGFCVYNPATLLRLREAVGDMIGANFDPSHLIWQGMDPVAAIRELTGAIYHVHAKDTKIDKYNTAKNGVLDTKHYGDEIHRAWVFRTVGYGNGETYWRDLVSNLRLCGYDRVLSIEHEDSLMTLDEGLKKAIDFLNGIIITEEKPTSMAWA